MGKDRTGGNLFLKGWQCLLKVKAALESRRVDQRLFLGQLDQVQTAFERCEPTLVKGQEEVRRQAYDELRAFFHPETAPDREESRVPTLTSLYFARSRILLFLPDPELRQTIALCRSEIQQMQDLPELAAETVLPESSFKQTLAAMQPAPWQNAVLFYRAQYLVDRLYGLIKSVKEREYARQKSARSVLAGLILLFLVLALLASVFTRTIHAIHPLVWWIMLFGGIGATTSIMQRIQKVVVDDYSVAYLVRLRHGWFSLWISIMLGATFALILALVFSSGLAGLVFSKEIAQAVAQTGGPVAGRTTFFLLDFGGRAGNLQENSWALLFAFLSGFSERLVPDVLSRIEQEALAGQKTKADSRGQAET
jgi:hypothetical protein